ncbi:tetratricopeptide repeat protein [Desulfonatronovibrio magnus]|uniref:tetratricopeptide repeat protein n=1 Tax=Desulfonatronovibrio magnus TaxID=698827 RepID=UPI0012F874A1|nr:tetratricopeptide repeat protein [Desulfonatronovibrio magnus]
MCQIALLKNDSPATVNVSETISVSEKDEPLSDMMDQDEDEELLIAGIDPVNESRVIPANNNDYTPLTVEQFSEKKPVVDASSDLSVQARPAVLPAAKTDREFKSSSQFPDDLGHFVLDTELVDHFSRQAERNRRAMALNKNIESAFASGDYNAFVRYLTMLNEILPEQSPLILKWEGILAMQQENYEQARDKFTAVLNRAPEDHIARANLALALVRLDQKAQARVLLAQLKIQVPDNPLVQTLSRVLQ